MLQGCTKQLLRLAFLLLPYLTLSQTEIQVGADIKINVVTVTSAGTIVISTTDYYIRMDATAGAQTYTLPTSTSGRVLIFKRIDNNPMTTVTFTGTVDGITNPNSTDGGPLSSIMSQFGTIILIGNSTDWDKI